MKIVLHGTNALTFRQGLEDFLDSSHEIVTLPDLLDKPEELAAYESADVIIGIRFNSASPVASALRLYQVPGAGHDGIDQRALPETAWLCNCFGHENAIAEYVFAALLARYVPLADADERLRQGDWKYWAGGPSGLRGELGSTTIGILGFGHIGKTLAARARAFGMTVNIANRSPVPAGAADNSFPLEDLEGFMASADAIINTLPLSEETRGIVGTRALEKMRAEAIVVNVGRGPVIDEAALFSALKERRIGGAIIDTWYVYPSADNPYPQPANLPFRELDNVIMTPHMSGWTHGTIRRRQAAMATNINRLSAGLDPVNVVRQAL